MNDEREAAVAAVYDLNWAFRAHMDKESKWTTPPVVDALQFAHQETGEVGDAEIRTRDYARNNERPADVVGELADVAFMLATALPVGQVAMEDITTKPARLPANPDRMRLSRISRMVAEAWDEWESGNHGYAERQAANALHMVVAIIGADRAEAEVAKRFLAIYAKHAAKGDKEPQVVAYMRGLVGGDTAVEGEGDGEGDE